MSIFLCGRLKPSVIYSTRFSCYSHASVIRDQTLHSVASCSGQSQWNNLAQFPNTYCWKLLTSHTYYLINNTRSYRDKYFLSISQSSIHLNTLRKEYPCQPTLAFTGKEITSSQKYFNRWRREGSKNRWQKTGNKSGNKQ